MKPLGPNRNTTNGVSMSFDDIGKALGISGHAASQLYYRGLRKLQKSYAAMDLLVELSEYHHQLRARSAECSMAQERW